MNGYLVHNLSVVKVKMSLVTGCSLHVGQSSYQRFYWLHQKPVHSLHSLLLNSQLDDLQLMD